MVIWWGRGGHVVMMMYGVVWMFGGGVVAMKMVTAVEWWRLVVLRCDGGDEGDVDGWMVVYPRWCRSVEMRVAWCGVAAENVPEKDGGVKQSKEGIFISPDKYVAEILKKFEFSSVRTTSTPIETQKPLVKDEDAADVDVHLYRSMIGSLMYLIASRPDIMFAVCACSRFQVTPKLSHLHTVKRIFRYLKGQPKLGLWYLRDSLFVLEAYSDSDYAGANLDRKSTTGGCQFLGRRLISWQCKKQTIIATSTTEAEYVAAANCYGQVLWIQNQMLDYGFNFMNTKIYIDNESIICIVKNPVYH
nr:uncharacterized mitochondrial protein AtMg00810-like [Tanacetum cinerariifolium]